MEKQGRSRRTDDVVNGTANAGQNIHLRLLHIPWQYTISGDRAAEPELTGVG